MPELLASQDNGATVKAVCRLPDPGAEFLWRSLLGVLAITRREQNITSQLDQWEQGYSQVFRYRRCRLEIRVQTEATHRDVERWGDGGLAADPHQPATP
jgi:hypothetical protein